MHIRKTLIGLLIVCQPMFGGCSSTPVRTETVTVYTPRYVALPQELTNQVPEPSIRVRTNRDLSDLAIAFQIALAQANRQLEAIREIQP